ncbi:L-threonylcarbamoyladenylate synthase [Mammaliicoccus stepanovicii]|uniref:Threonylcarbamoyl-AMP synthase n=1 Tax=Mammaliicoccus stepanovicii TaxID=643214 RepID=A0A239YN96_9STAP|nr:L-threonylcarbamoyladenylate synthase [Mammaliicoccus stepanovicii]PNZ78915.1 threonylcarbamoyl-AMP synthase [Mammaliicoccus stepanovicii]GGI41227.1 threonylcarbamoyl-AMP synthase [Mammaliicoccus stepanovicii]SNV60287.1 translation factor [Mammaliicoccus stepanovicii]
MKTYVWDVRKYVDNLQSYPQINNIIEGYHQNQLIALPTETVYGLGANAKNTDAVKSIYVAKGRPSDNPLIVHIHDRVQLEHFTHNISRETEILMEALWPGPISFIVPYKTGYLSDLVTGGLESVAVRMPRHNVGREILKLVNLPIAAPSANLSGRPSPTKYEHVKHDLDGRIFGIIQADEIDEGIESTVIDCTSFPFKIARPGSITAEKINEILPNSIIDKKVDIDKPIAPGMKYKHYAPTQPVTLIEGGLTKSINPSSLKGIKIAVIGPKTIEPFIPENAKFIPLSEHELDIKGAHRHLYDALRIADQLNDIDHILISGFERNAKTMALMNRLDKASGHNIKREDEL